MFFKGPFGGAYLRREICVSKSIGLAYSSKEIYVSNLQQVFALRMKIFLKLNHASTLSIWTEENIYPSQPEE